MTMTYTQLSEMNNALDNELDDIYTHNLRLLDTNHELISNNTKLEVLVGILKNQIKRIKSS